MRTSGLAGIVTAFVLACSSAPAAQGNGNGNGNANGARQSFRNQQRRLRRAHFRAQHSENGAFRQSIKEKTPADKCGAMIPHRNTQYGENKSFRRSSTAAGRSS